MFFLAKTSKDFCCGVFVVWLREGKRKGRWGMCDVGLLGTSFEYGSPSLNRSWAQMKVTGCEDMRKMQGHWWGWRIEGGRGGHFWWR